MIVEHRFEPVRLVFEEHFSSGKDIGARFTVCLDGEVAVDLWSGWADKARERPFDASTLAPIYSTTKAISAVMLARLVDAGRLSYDQRVADVWPEFAQAGKAEITVAQALSHQAGLAGFTEPMDPSEWFDWDAICARLAAMPPLWPPGTASGYHPITWGYVAGEIFRRIDGRTIGAALAEDLAGPFGLDVFIGLPGREHARVAEMELPRALADFGELNPATRAAFLMPWSSPGKRGVKAYREAEIPSANGHATAEGLARLMSALACGGSVTDRRILSQATIAAASRERIRGQDLVLPFVISWGAGFMRNAERFIYGPDPRAFGHSGWGGSCAFADPARRLSAAYVMNRQSPHLIGDPRPLALIEAVYRCL